MQKPGEKSGKERRAEIRASSGRTHRENQRRNEPHTEENGTRPKTEHRHLLLIMPSFFDLPEKIMEAAGKLGFETFFVDDRPSQCTAVKALLRLNRNLLPMIRKRYCEQVIRKVEEQEFDAVLVISGQSLCFDEETMDRLRFLFPRARFVLYQWDSLANFPGIARLWPWFDRRYTFDPRDAREHPGLSFLPLFYVPDGNEENDIQHAGNDIQENKEKDRNGEKAPRADETDVTKAEGADGAEEPESDLYDLAFVGTAHPGKLAAVDEIAEKLRGPCPRQFLYRYLPSRLLYWYRFLQNPEFRAHAPWDFHYRKLEGEKVRSIRRRTRIILDSPQNHQTGLTLRCIGAVGADRKLITTNADIRNYDFYHPENILIWEPKHPPDPQEIEWFLHIPMAPLNDRTKKRYTIETFLSTLLGSRAADGSDDRREKGPGTAGPQRTVPEGREKTGETGTVIRIAEEMRKENRIETNEKDITNGILRREGAACLSDPNRKERSRLPLRFAIDLTWCRPGEIGGIEKSTRNLLLGLKELAAETSIETSIGKDGKENGKEDVRNLPFFCTLLVTENNRDAFASLLQTDIERKSGLREKKPGSRQIMPEPCFALLTMEGDYRSPEKRLWSLHKYLEPALQEQNIGICLEPGGSRCFTGGGGIRYLTVIHDLQPLDLPKNFGLRKRIGRRILYAWTFHHSDVLIAVSEFTKERICHFAPYARNRTICIPDAVTLHEAAEKDEPGKNGSCGANGEMDEKDVKKENSGEAEPGEALQVSWEADTAEIRKKTGIQWGSYYFTVSSCLPHKNLETLLRVMAELKRRQRIRPSDWITGREDMPEKLLIAGIPQEKPGGKRRRHLEKQIRKLHLEKNVYLLGPVTERERNALYRGCTAFLFPSLYEGFGMPPVEAVLAGAPAVIAAGNASIPEVLSVFETKESTDTQGMEKTERSGKAAGSEKTVGAEKTGSSEETERAEKAECQTRICLVDKPEDPGSWLVSMQSAWLIAFTDALQHTWERHHERKNPETAKRAGREQESVSFNPYAPEKIARAYLGVIAKAADWNMDRSADGKNDRIYPVRTIHSTESRRGA